MSPEPVEELVVALYRLGLVQRAIARRAAAELGSQGFSALGVIAGSGPVRVSAVAEQLSVDLSVASRQVAALVLAGHVERGPDPDDRRATALTITPEGRRVLRESHGHMVASAARALEDWTEDEISGLAAQLERLRADVARVTSTPNRQQQEHAA